MKTREIRIGMIGSGFMGRTYSECLHRYVKGGRLMAVAGGQRAPQLAQDYAVEFETSVEALVGREDVDAVIISTPEMVHLEQTLMAAASGKHVLVEKPMAPTVAQCTTMINACRESGVTLMVVQSQRFRGVNHRAQQLLATGRIGNLRQVRHWLLRPVQNSQRLVASRPFYSDPAGGGLFMGFGSHSFDMVNWLSGGQAQSVFAQTTSYGDHDIPNLAVMAQVTFENDVLAQVWLNAEMPGQTFSGSRFSTQLVGATGLLDFDGYGHLNLATAEGWQRVWDQPSFDATNPQDPLRLESFVAMIQEYVDAIRQKRTPAVTGEEGRAAVELCEAVLMSSSSGQPIRLPLTREES
jgi:predicted dehydrogenase